MFHDEIVGFCTYCKEDIYAGEDYVKHNDDMYHIDCYDLMRDELSEEKDESTD